MLVDVICWDDAVEQMDINLLIPDHVYHSTPRSRLASILEHGLVPGSPRHSKEGEPKGIYLIQSVDFLRDDVGDDGMHFAGDEMVYLKVNVVEFKHLLKPDPEWRSSSMLLDDPRLMTDDIAWYVDFTIPPRHIVGVFDTLVECLKQEEPFTPPEETDC